MLCLNPPPHHPVVIKSRDVKVYFHWSIRSRRANCNLDSARGGTKHQLIVQMIDNNPKVKKNLIDLHTKCNARIRQQKTRAEHGFFLINSISGINPESGKESFDTEPKSYSIQHWIEPRSICTIAARFWFRVVLRMIVRTLNDSNLL